MKPRPITEEDVTFWAKQRPGELILRRTYRAPEFMDNCEDVTVLIVGDTIRIPWIRDQRDEGVNLGTTWLTIFGQGMPPVDMLVTIP